MKSFLAFVVLIGLIGFAIWEHTTISSLNEQISSLNGQLAALRAPRAATVSKKIICPLCHGERVVAHTPPGETKLRPESEPRPVCLGLGYRVLRILPRHH